ncbi:hypothetical protein FPSE5266_20361 [Fusarium pseudograminearum]|nr:hypothetical protein FPSE5266_20361 [Fusarium pseudograminearum]
MFHELTHWFGGWAEINDPNERARPDILDQSALDKHGNERWTRNGVPVRPGPALDWGEAERNGLARDMAYGFEEVFRLARCYGKNKAHCGPLKAIKNADSLTFFALAMYLDEWDWHAGVAMFPDKNYSKRGPPT